MAIFNLYNPLAFRDTLMVKPKDLAISQGGEVWYVRFIGGR